VVLPPSGEPFVKTVVMTVVSMSALVPVSVPVLASAIASGGLAGETMDAAAGSVRLAPISCGAGGGDGNVALGSVGGFPDPSEGRDGQGGHAAMGSNEGRGGGAMGDPLLVAHARRMHRLRMRVWRGVCMR
jgi:hypothetical protein